MGMQAEQEIAVKKIVIDFDSTFMQVEGMEELAAISLANHPEKEARIKEITRLTNLAMEGELSFRESLKLRLSAVEAHKNHLPLLVDRLREKVSASFTRNKQFFTELSEHILIVSAGFKEFIEPIVSPFGIRSENIYANTFVFDPQGNIIGFDENNPLSKDKGKVILMQELDLPGETYVIGDGYTDYEIKEAGLAHKFYAFTENIARPSVLNVADHIAPSLDEFLYQHNLPMTFSYPKSRIKVLLLENIHPHAVDVFKAEGYQIETISGALDEAELIEQIKGVSILGIRSKTMVTAKVLEHADKLIAIGAFCIGTNQIDLKTCTQKGVAVFNAPYSNTRSVVELAIGEIITLTRNLIDKNAKMHRGVWDKSAGNSREIRGKKLGIIGYGNIGTQLSVLAEALGMQVLFYDRIDKLALGNARKCASLEELLKEADIVSLHIDGRKENTNFINAEVFQMMKQGVIFLNLSRGHIVDVDALAENVRNGRIAGAGIDVFPYEPKTNNEEFLSVLRDLPNVLLTPHIGGSTEEAQYNIADYVPDKLISYINTGNTYNSVNFPNLQLPEFSAAHRLLHIHDNVSGILAKINSTLAANGVNIVGQYLKTNESIGYVITDVDKEYNKLIIQELKGLPNTIKFRVLY